MQILPIDKSREVSTLCDAPLVLMSATALIMAGGLSERMRATVGPTHKSMVPVCGVTLLERNLYSLLAQGFRDIDIVVSARETDVQDFVSHRLTTLAHANGAALRCTVEMERLGNVGAVRKFRDRSGALLVTFADNLSTLDLVAMLRHHNETRAVMTIAVHDHALRIPYGEVISVGGRALEYREKPITHLTISSGYFILEPRVCNYIPDNALVSAADLFETLKGAGELIATFKHSSLWVDVNDASSLAEAELLVSDNMAAFSSYQKVLGPQSAEEA